MKVYRSGEIEFIDPTPMPYCYAPSKYEIQTQAKMDRTDMRTFDTGEAVKRYTFPQPMNVKAFRSFQEAKGIPVYEADKKYVSVWMTDNDLVCDDYPNQAAWDTEEDDSGPKCDPETANVPITAIGLVHNGEKIAWTGPEKSILQNTVDYIVKQKIQLLKGWNTHFWDVPIFAKRLAYAGIKFDFSSVRFLDLALCYRFMEKNFRSQWALEKVGRRLFNEQKPFVNVRLSTLPVEQLKERVLWDADMTNRIDEKKEYTRVAIQLAKQSHIFPDQIFGIHPEKKSITITPILDQYFLRYAHKIGYVLPCKTGYKQRPKYPGGWVEVFEQGFFENVLQYDVDSLYPNVILAYKLAPLGRFELVEPIVRDLLAGKRNAKDEVERWSYKITVNALYGIFASSYYRFKAVEVADAITFHGRDILTHTAEFLRSMGYTVYYMDTDSCFVKGNFDEAETIRNLMNDYVQRTYNVENIKFGLENYWSLIGFPRGAKGEKTKKRYYGIVHVNKKGEVVDKFEEAGMEGLRGDWCELAREVQDAIKKFQVTKVPKEKMLEFYEDTKVKLYQGLYDPFLVMEKHMGKDVGEYGKMKKDEKTGKMRKMPTPQHVKAIRDAMATGWVPTDMVQYGVVQYYMTRGAIPKLVNLVKPGEIDYGWYVSHQIDPIVWRLGIIEETTKYKKEKVVPKTQATLD
jgi:DNA polymerase I